MDKKMKTVQKKSLRKRRANPIGVEQRRECGMVMKDLSAANERLSLGVDMAEVEKFLEGKYLADPDWMLGDAPLMFMSYGTDGRGRVLKGEEQSRSVVVLAEKHLKGTGSTLVGRNSRRGKFCLMLGRDCQEMARLLREDVDVERSDFKDGSVKYRAIPYLLTSERKFKCFKGTRLKDV